MGIRLWALTQKELIQIIRDRKSLISIILMPSFVLLLFAVAVHTEVKHIPMVVADQSISSSSRSYLKAFTTSGTFDIISYYSTENEVKQSIDSGQASIGMVIPPDFANQVERQNAKVLLLLDGSTSFTTQTANNAANSISQQYAVNLIETKTSGPLIAHFQILYNPDLKDLWFITPAFIAFLLQASAMNLTSLAVVREREMGTIEAILVTPIRPLEFLLGKTLPTLVVVFITGVLLLVFSVFILGVPMRGNLILLIILSLINACCGLGFGLVVSTAVQTQNQSYQLSQLLNLSGMFLAGILFPAYAMPLVLRIIGSAFPASHFVPILRGLFLKGTGLSDLWGESLVLVCLMVVTLFISTRLFKQNLE